MNERATPLLALVTVRTAEEANALADAVVEARLAASAQVRPLGTVYRWQGKVARHEEHEVALFTTDARWSALVAFVTARHAYVLPQVVAVPITRGFPPFLAWIDENVAEVEEP